MHNFVKFGTSSSGCEPRRPMGEPPEPVAGLATVTSNPAPRGPVTTLRRVVRLQAHAPAVKNKLRWRSRCNPRAAAPSVRSPRS